MLFQILEPIDDATPKEARSRTGFDGHKYELVFSAEFEVDGKTFGLVSCCLISSYFNIRFVVFPFLFVTI